MAGLVLAHMKSTGTSVIQGRIPQSVVRLETQKLKVEWSDGSDEYDTILVAVGRSIVQAVYTTLYALVTYIYIPWSYFQDLGWVYMNC